MRERLVQRGVYGTITLAVAFGIFFAWSLYADVANIDPNGNGGTTQGTQTTCGAGGYYDCVNDAVRSPTSPSTSGDYLQLTNNQVGFFQMGTLTNVATATSITVYIHHVEGSANFFHEIGLFALNETTQYGTLQNVTNYTTAGGRWDTVTFSPLTLTQSQLDDLRIRIACRRTGGNSNCRNHAFYAEVTYSQVQNVTVSGGGTQQDIAVGATNAHVGGRFAIVENTSSRTISAITIAEQGTVDAQNHLDNIRLHYEFDTVTPYNCAGESYGGTEARFGAIDTDGFSAANGTSAFSTSSPLTITTTQALCIYTVLDVSSSATAGQTVEIQITNPSTDVTASTGVVGPTSAATIPGTTTLTAPNLTQIRYHWRNDDNDEANASSATGGTENTAYSVFPKLLTKRLRLEVSNEGTATSNSTAYRLEYGKKVTTCSALTGGDWVDVGAGGGDFDMSSTGNLTDGNNTTNVLSSALGAVTDENTNFIGTGAVKDTSSQTSGITLTSTEFVELEYAIEATSGTVPGDTYCFRVTNAGTEIHTYSVYPEATIAADIAVSSGGSQTATIDIPTTNSYVGGYFAIVDQSSSHTVTSITIAASGTVDYQNDIDNIRLFYEFDTSNPYNCASVSYNGTEARFGAIDTDGFSATATSTFSTSSPPTVTTTQTMCVYVVFDVGSGASNGETLDIKINSPATDVVVTGASVAPSSLTSISGMTTLVNDNPTQIRYHWRNDDSDEANASSATGGTEGVALSDLPKSTRKRLRLEVSNEGGTSTPSIAYRLEYAQKISTCSAATGWTDVGAGGGEWDMSNTVNLTDGNNTTNVLSSALGAVTDENTNFIGTGAVKDTSSQTSGITLTSTQFLELEYSVIATTNSLAGATYCFRVTDAGTPITTYSLYPEATIKLPDDFFVQRDVSTFVSGSSTLTLVAGVDYTAPSASTSAFIRITNTHHTGAGTSLASANQNSDDVTAYIINPSNILSSVTLGRPSGASADTRVAWEIVEYVGPAGGDNEFVVRQQQTVTYGTSNTTVTTPTVSGVVTDADIVPFITGQANPDTGRADYNTGLSTAAWDSSPDTVTFTRGEANGEAVIVSYAVVEFTGTNWKIQRSEHTYTSAGATSTQSISSVNSLSRTFLHTQKRVGSGLDTHANFGHEVWLSSVGVVSYFLDSQATTPSGHVSVAWVIENIQTGGTPMIVTRSNGTQTGGTAPLTTNVNIGKTLDDLSIASIFMNNRSDGTGSSFPEPMIATRLISTTQYEMWVSNTGDTRRYRTEVVEWPTAPRKLEQNYYQFYVDNDALTPSDPWPAGASNLGENTAITGTDTPPASGDVLRLRMTLLVQGANMPAGVDAFKLQYGERVGGSCSAIASNDWRDLGSTSSTTALWRGYNATPADGTTLDTFLITSVSDVFGTYEEENNTALTPNAAVVDDDVEFDWVIQHNGAEEKTYYCFRMIEAGGTVLSDYNFYPTLQTAGYGVQSQNWQWFDDAENTTPIDDLALENVSPIDIAFENEITLRLTLREVNGAASDDVKFKLQFSEHSNFSTSTDVVSIGACTDNSLWCYADGGGADNATVTSAVLTDSDTCAGGVGNGCGSYNETGTSTSTFRHEAAAAAEYSFTLRHSGARVNRVYYFRVYDYAHNEAVPLGSGETYPSLSTAGASLTFTSDSVLAGVSTEGIVTDVETTVSGVAFGSLTPNAEVEAAQRFNITTNATEGYQVLMYARSALVSSGGDVIAAVTGTNASPSGWSTGCDVGATGCFGYHAGDDILAGGSTRFAANNTYAGFSGTPQEIAYSSTPVTNDVTDLVYKVQVREGQPAGQYEADIAFIVVPVF